MRNYKKNRRSRAKSSYESYKEHREQWEKKGYSLDEELNEEKFNEVYELAKKKGMKNIVREIAKAERTITLDFARNIINKYNEITGENYTAKEFLSLKFKGAGDKVEYESKGKKNIRNRSNREALYLFFKEHGIEEDVYGY